MVRTLLSGILFFAICSPVVAVHIFGPSTYSRMPLDQLYYNMLKWGLGPALLSVYISYYLDRQTCQDLPDIDHSPGTRGWRLLNCLGFAAVTVFLLLPQLLSLTAQPNAAWDSGKLRFIATATTFCMTFAMAFAAQFALRKDAQATGAVLSPRLSLRLRPARALTRACEPKVRRTPGV